MSSLYFLDLHFKVFHSGLRGSFSTQLLIKELKLPCCSADFRGRHPSSLMNKYITNKNTPNKEHPHNQETQDRGWMFFFPLERGSKRSARDHLTCFLTDILARQRVEMWSSDVATPAHSCLTCRFRPVPMWFKWKSEHVYSRVTALQKWHNCVAIRKSPIGPSGLEQRVSLYRLLLHL